MPRIILAVLALALAPIATRATDECRSESDHVGQRECLERLASQSADEVAAAEAAAAIRIERWDEESVYIARSLELLNALATNFRAYRAARCELAASSAAGGNGAGDIRLDCEIQLNRTYAAEVRSLW